MADRLGLNARQVAPRPSSDRGRVTFIGVNRGFGISAAKARRVLDDADIVIWPSDLARDALGGLIADGVQVIDIDGWSDHTLMPIYDLAVRDGFRVAHVHLDGALLRPPMLDVLNRCAELGLEMAVMYAL
jgi:precorrin-4 methylase